MRCADTIVTISMLCLFAASPAALAESKSPAGAAGAFAKRALSIDAEPSADADAANGAEPAADAKPAAEDGTSEPEEKSEEPAATETEGQAASESEKPSDSAAADAGPATGDMKDWTQHVVSPIFSELVMFAMPGNFAVAFENTKDDFYIREAVPKGETVEQWTEMITVTGNKGMASRQDMTPQAYFDYFASRFNKACPDTFSYGPFDSIEVQGHESYVGIASCGAVAGPTGPHSETTVFLIIKGARDYYTIQWAERGEASQSPLKLDRAEWDGRLAKLKPVHVCVRKAGEQAPYPSCVASR